MIFILFFIVIRVENERLGLDYYDDTEVYELRAKDEFRDANPAGAGNSKLKPCGWKTTLDHSFKNDKTTMLLNINVYIFH